MSRSPPPSSERQATPTRGGETLDMLAAMSTGHQGSLSTLHASAPDDALLRVQTLALMGDVDLPYRAVGDQVGSALDLIVHQARRPDGSRAVIEVAAVAPTEGGPRATTLVRRRSTGGGMVWSAVAARWIAQARADGAALAPDPIGVSPAEEGAASDRPHT